MVRFTPLRVLQALCVAVLVWLLVTIEFLHRPRGYDLLEVGAAGSFSSNEKYGQSCSPFAAGAMKDVTVVLKMGASEVATRLPAYLDRFDQCDPDFLLFSDREDKYKGLEIRDAIANLDPKLRRGNPDFDVYEAIQRSNGTGEKTHGGWRLDKYKFLPMMELARHARPGSDWFVFIELDTYVNWDNMHRFLLRSDPREPYYFGSPVWPRKKPVFAHGGTGFVLSGAALDKLVARGRAFSESPKILGSHLFGKDMQKECCGDEVLASVLKDSGVVLKGYWPMFNGEKPSSIRFDDEQWCEAILTLHHLSMSDFADLDRWESSARTASEPLTFEKLFTYIEPSLQDRIDDWSDLSEDFMFDSTGAGESFESCLAACSKDCKCMQFEHVSQECRLSHGIRLGHRQPAEGDRTWTSGWMMDRIRDFKATHSPCKGVHFVHPNP